MGNSGENTFSVGLGHTNGPNGGRTCRCTVRTGATDAGSKGVTAETGDRSDESTAESAAIMPASDSGMHGVAAASRTEAKDQVESDSMCSNQDSIMI